MYSPPHAEILGVILVRISTSTKMILYLREEKGSSSDKKKIHSDVIPGVPGGQED